MTHLQRAQQFIDSWGPIREGLGRGSDRAAAIQDLANEFTRVALEAISATQVQSDEGPK